ncbi:MAG: hypothetical protein LBR65_04560 [Culturomica sp.]|jgi:glutathione synthase/RimK-type ligase-like ATP-grasp enzyme|nr:hypothetical protein [Culturomica sp.]
MIYIYTTAIDITTNSVINWLNYYEAPFTRINDVTDFYQLFINWNNTPKRDVHWFWKWNHPAKFTSGEALISDLQNHLNSALKEEYRTIFHLHFNNIHTVVNHPKHIGLDKFSQLMAAQKCGLKIPDTLITSSKGELQQFALKYDNIITKNFSASLTIASEGEIYKTYTSILNAEKIRKLPDSFFPSLFQQYIDKKFEIRVIYIGGKIYSCALLASNNIVDVRQSNQQTPIRILPYKIPENIELQIRAFMSITNLQLGSIDLIYNQQDEYYFLEINPSGQFLGYSTECNYCVEKEVANYLIQRSYE